MESKKDTGIQFHCQVRLAEGTREIHKFSCFIHLTINPSEIGVKKAPTYRKSAIICYN